MPSGPPQVAPVQPGERLGLLDALRGFALLGILLANVVVFGGPTPPATPLDAVATRLELFFVEDKFYALFSLLFGVGFALQVGRAQARGADPAAAYRRRLWALLGIGLAHSVLVWDGDILTLYAVVGFVLLGLRGLPDRLVWPLVVLGPAASVLVHYAWAVMGMIGRKGFVVGDATGSLLAGGSYGEILARRLLPDDLAYVVVGEVVGFGPVVLALFLVGRWVGRSGLLADPGAHRRLLGRVLVVAGPSGAVLNALALGQVPLEGANARFAAAALLLVGGLGLCLAYASGFALLWSRPAWRAGLGWLAPAGRMALTNYLAQSIAATTLFYGYGLGLYGRTGAAARLGIALAIFAVGLTLSRWWLRRFRYGPAEWLWRRLTYGRA